MKSRKVRRFHRPFNLTDEQFLSAVGVQPCEIVDPKPEPEPEPESKFSTQLTPSPSPLLPSLPRTLNIDEISEVNQQLIEQELKYWEQRRRRQEEQDIRRRPDGVDWILLSIGIAIGLAIVVCR